MSRCAVCDKPFGRYYHQELGYMLTRGKCYCHTCTRDICDLCWNNHLSRCHECAEDLELEVERMRGSFSDV